MGSQGVAAIFGGKETVASGVRLPIHGGPDHVSQETIGKQLEKMIGPGTNEPRVNQIDMHDYEDWSYFVEVEIGTPSQKFNMSIMTSEANSYVYSKDCWSLPCFFYPLYDKSLSSTYQKTPWNYSRQIMSVVGGSFDGDIMIEKMKLGNIEIPEYPIGMVSSVAGNGFVSNRVSGVLGLGPNSIYSSPFHYPNFLAAANVTSYSIYKRTGDKQSYLHLNEMDSENFEPIHTHNVINNTWINLNMTHITVDGVTVQTPGTYATIASGFEGIAGSTAIFNAAFGPLVIAKDCSNLYDLPDLTIGIDGFNYTLTAYDYVVQFKGECSKPFFPFDAPPPLNQHFFIGEP